MEAHQNLVDGGVVTPPQFGPFGFDRTWLIEGHGVDPDIEVPNLPADVLEGTDSQLEAGIRFLLNKIKEAPMDIPPTPPFPDKSKKAG